MEKDLMLSRFEMFSFEKPLSKKSYILGILTIFVCVYSQYFVRYGQIFGFLVVYGIPVLVVSLLFGRQMLSRAAKNNVLAAKLGMGLFGAFTALGIFLMAIALSIILVFEPGAGALLTKPNPVLEGLSANAAWVMIAVSFLVVGTAEEYLFRGFMYGGLLSISKGKHWFLIAVGSSFLFSIVHAYYAVAYGVASVLPFIALITFSVAMAVTFYWSGGNLLVPALIHGAYDATGFLTIAVSMEFGLAARGLLIAVGGVFAAVYLTRRLRMPEVPNAAV
jgi:membrane protease YdiL (CAAX protease family)